MSGWIDVAKARPSDKEYVWCFGVYDGCEPTGFEGYRDATRDKWWALNNGDYVDGGYGHDYEAKVSHWMPLPDKPDF